MPTTAIDDIRLLRCGNCVRERIGAQTSPHQLHAPRASLEIFNFQLVAVAFLQRYFCDRGPGVVAFGIINNHFAVQPQPVEAAVQAQPIGSGLGRCEKASPAHRIDFCFGGCARSKIIVHIFFYLHQLGRALERCVGKILRLQSRFSIWR